jgi:hypothetical protein
LLTIKSSSFFSSSKINVKLLFRFEDDKNISGLFEELWEDSTSGERVTIHLYLGEIVSLICEGLASSSWTSKRKVILSSLLQLASKLIAIVDPVCVLLTSIRCMVIACTCSQPRQFASLVKLWVNHCLLITMFCSILL